MNYIRILSKSSLLSSTSSSKSITPSEEVTRLHTEIEKLKQTIESLKLTVESRDAAIGTLAREKEKLYVELKTAQRTNRNLHQQLEDERDMHSKEKEYLIHEIKRVANNNESTYNDNQEDTIDNLMQEEMRSKDEIICNICSKYLKIKSSKIFLQREFRKLQSESQKACENVIMLLEDNKKSLDDFLEKLIEYSKAPPESKKYFKILRHNANLYYENTQLKVRITTSLHRHFAHDPWCTKRNKNSNTFKKVSKLKAHRKNINSNNIFNTIYNTDSTPQLLYKAISDTCLAVSRK